MKSQNLDKLNDEEKDLLAFIMMLQNWFWDTSYMVEVARDNPIRNMLLGGEGKLRRHAGNGSREYAHYYGNQNYVIVHIDDEDVKDWNWIEMALRAQERIDLGNYNQYTGEE